VDLDRERFKVVVALALSTFERLDSSRPLLAVFFASLLVPIRISVQVSDTLVGSGLFSDLEAARRRDTRVSSVLSLPHHRERGIYDPLTPR
jgi:hypothetical protein